MSKYSPILPEDGWFKGEHKRLRFLIVDADDQPLDVSSYAMGWTLQTQGASADVLHKETPSGVTIENGAGVNDAVVVTVGGEDTTALAPDIYRHALRRTGTDQEQVLAYGEAHLLEAATEG